MKVVSHTLMADGPYREVAAHLAGRFVVCDETLVVRLIFCVVQGAGDHEGK